MSHRLAVELQQRGWKVEVVCVERIDRGPRSGVAWHDEEYDGLQVHRLEFDLGNSPDPWQWSYDNQWIGEHLEARWKVERPDVVLLVGGYLLTSSVLAAAKRLTIPTAVRLTDFWFLCPRIHLLRSNGSLSTLPIDTTRCAQCLGEEKRRYRIPGRILPRLMRRFWQRQKAATERVQARQRFLHERLVDANVLTTESKFLRDSFVGAGIPEEQIVQIRQGTHPFIVPPVTRARGATLRLGYFGQIVQPKGVHVLIEAIQRQSALPVHLDVFGDTSRDPDYTKSLQRRVDPRVRWHELLRSPSAIRDALHGLDVVCVPSIWYENSPNAILEALAAGVPVIASAIGGMAELVHDGRNGLLFPAGDSDALGRHLRDLVHQPELLASLQRGISPVESMAQEVDKLEALFRRIISEQPGSKMQPLQQPTETPPQS